MLEDQLHDSAFIFRKLKRNTRDLRGVVRHFTPSVVASAIHDNPAFVHELAPLVHAARGWGIRALTGQFHNDESIGDFILDVRAQKADHVILALHGYFGVGSHFGEVYGPILERNYELPFYAAEYRTFRPIEAAGRYTWSLVKKILEHTDARVTLLAHSLGGLVALDVYYRRLSLKQQQRIHSLILLSGPHQGTDQAIYGYGESAREMEKGSSYLFGSDGLVRLYPDLPDGEKIWSFSSRRDAIVAPKDAYLPIPQARNHALEEFGIHGVSHIDLLFREDVVHLVGTILTR